MKFHTITVKIMIILLSLFTQPYLSAICPCKVQSKPSKKVKKASPRTKKIALAQQITKKSDTANLREHIGREIESVIANHPYVIIDFWAIWCGPCLALSETLITLAQQYPHVYIAKINVDKNKEISRQYGISALPTLLFFANGHRVHRSMGNKSLSSLKQLCDDHFKEA